MAELLLLMNLVACSVLSFSDPAVASLVESFPPPAVFDPPRTLLAANFAWTRLHLPIVVEVQEAGPVVAQLEDPDLGLWSWLPAAADLCVVCSFSCPSYLQQRGVRRS
jgi:hypothetical protein